VKPQFIIFVFLLLFAPVFVFAVREVESTGNFIAEVRPENPAPGERVVITLKSFGSNLDGNSISWYLNNQLQTQYNNQKQFSFFAGKAGSNSQVKIIIRSNNLQMSKTLVFEPAEVDLIWQAGTEVPLFYQGKALPSPGSPVKILAIPTLMNSSGQKASPESLAYRWYVNGNLVSNASGLGRHSFLTSANQDYSEKVISVLVSDSTSGLVAESSIKIKPRSPKILFYESKPLEGIDFSRVLGTNISLIAEEITIKAQPYFFSLGRIGQSSFNWLLNNQKFTPPGDRSLVTFRRKSETEGVSRINLTVAGDDSLQKAVGSFLINFNNRVIDFNNAAN